MASFEEFLTDAASIEATVPHDLDLYKITNRAVYAARARRMNVGDTGEEVATIYGVPLSEVRMDELSLE